MRKTQQIAAVVILILAGITVYGFLQTRPVSPPEATNGKPGTKPLVVLRPLKTAQQLAQTASTREERTLAQEALRLADYDVDLAFDEAIRDARLHPPPLSPEAIVCKARKDKAEQALETAQANAKQLSEQLVKTPPDKQPAVEADLIQAEADIDLAQDEVEDAKHDLQMAGGDSVERLMAMKKLHEEATQNSPATLPQVEESIEQAGLMHRIVRWRSLHQKQMNLWQAKADTERAQTRLSAKHDALDAQIESEKASLPELSRPARDSKTEASETQAPEAAKSHLGSKELLKKTEALASDQKIVASYDKRIVTKKELASVYGQWIELVAGYQKAVVHRALVEFSIILGIALVALFFTSWMDSLVRKVPMDRRQVESLRTVARVASQILALSLILLVMFGPPSQLGTFLGLAGAGLTVALKDWVEDFAGTLRRVLNFLDLPYDPACERFYEQDTKVRTVSRAQSGAEPA
jgi:hypothetical protein